MFVEANEEHEGKRDRRSPNTRTREHANMHTHTFQAHVPHALWLTALTNMVLKLQDYGPVGGHTGSHASGRIDLEWEPTGGNGGTGVERVYSQQRACRMHVVSSRILDLATMSGSVVRCRTRLEQARTLILLT
jgi:hypothetical protein